MIKYKIKLPLELEQKASCNKHNFSSSECINFQYENNDFSIKGSEGKYSIVLEHGNQFLNHIYLLSVY